MPGDLVGRQRPARHLDHRADHVFYAPALSREHRLGGIRHDLLLVLELLMVADQGNHDLGNHLDAFLGALHGGLEDRLRLHLRDFGEGDA